LSIVPCEQDAELRAQIEKFAEVLKTEAHKLGKHGLSEKRFYESPIFRGAIEQVRGEFSATTRVKHEFVQHVLNHMQDRGMIENWERAKRGELHDFVVTLPSGKVAIIDLKGCLDGDNTKLISRPDRVDEFIVWSLCTNAGADPRRNAWSGVHTRLGAEFVGRGNRVDGLIIWDMLCGSPGRQCPKMAKVKTEADANEIGPYRLPPPCLYLFPAEIPTLDQPTATAQKLENVEFLKAFCDCFGGSENDVNLIDFSVQAFGEKLKRRTVVRRGTVVQHSSDWTVIRRA
jgi:hypothetical protein